MAAPAIKTKKLSKYYGRHRGIEDLDLTVERGEVFGFLGPNGSGKSTTINVLMGFRKPTSGSARILGHPTGPNATALRRKVGYMPGELSLYEHMRARDLLTYFANLRGGVDEPTVGHLVARFGLDIDKRIRDLSKGNKQKVALVAAWMHQPELLILDEPTSGLDPIVQQEFQELVSETKQRGGTVFMSSHVLSEVEHVCDRAAVVKDGRIVAVERISNLHERSLRHVEITFSKRPPKGVLDRIDGVSQVRVDRNVVRCRVHGSMDAVIKRLAKHRVKNLTVEHASLEELFFEEYGEEVES